MIAAEGVRRLTSMCDLEAAFERGEIAWDRYEAERLRLGSQAVRLELPWERYEAEIYRQDLAEFVKAAWPIIEPGTELVWGWHHELICRCLESVTAGRIRKLIINIPPGELKSTLVSVMWPAWEWLTKPEERTIFVSHSQGLATRDSLKTRQIVESAWYKRQVQLLALNRDQEPWGLAKDQNQKTIFQNTLRGFRMCGTVRGSIIGHRGDKIVVDDPHDVREVIYGHPDRVAERMQEVVDWYDKVLSSRLNDKRTGARVIIQQRVHTRDLSGVLQEREGYVCLNLPTEYDPALAHPDDPRRTPGELLNPDRVGPGEVIEIKTELGDAQYKAQHGQDPQFLTGSLFQDDYWLYYLESPKEMARQCEEVAISVDCAFKDSKRSDFVAMQVWGRKGALRYLLDELHDRLDLPATCAALKRLSARWPEALVKLIEDKANGPGVIQTLRDEVEGITEFSPGQDSKYARAQVAARIFEARQVYLPDPRRYPWVESYKNELRGFPAARFDDRVDATSQIIIRWRSDSLWSSSFLDTGGL